MDESTEKFGTQSYSKHEFNSTLIKYDEEDENDDDDDDDEEDNNALER